MSDSPALALFAEPVAEELDAAPASTTVDIDLAKVSPCPKCGEPVRRFASTPIAGTNKDPITSGPWWCPGCLRAKTAAAAAHLHEVG